MKNTEHKINNVKVLAFRLFFHSSFCVFDFTLILKMKNTEHKINNVKVNLTINGIHTQNI